MLPYQEVAGFYIKSLLNSVITFRENSNLVQQTSTEKEIKHLKIMNRVSQNESEIQ